MSIRVTVHWGKERISHELPRPDLTPLRTLRDALKDHTGLDDFKLIHKGAVMKDDAAPISSYGIRQNSTVVLIPKSGAPVPMERVPTAESAMRDQIAAEIETVRETLAPEVEVYLSNLLVRQEQARLGELLLQSLLRLDSMTPNPEWEDARRERQAAVREVQKLLDRVDSV